MLCDNLEEWDGVGGRLKREGTYIYLQLICVDVWQKPIQYYTAITFQLKINKFLKTHPIPFINLLLPPYSAPP